MTWRERVQAARERGRFTEDDLETWALAWVCPAGEAAEACGLIFNEKTGVLWEIGDLMHMLMIASDFDGADRLLDDIDDVALELKREQAQP